MWSVQGVPFWVRFQSFAPVHPVQKETEDMHTTQFYLMKTMGGAFIFVFSVAMDLAGIANAFASSLNEPCLWYLTVRTGGHT
jgi:hypothetical protein